MSSEFYMERCLQLARLGSGSVDPNPMVGAVLVCNERIIGEGYHQKYGEAHAEVNCLNFVKENDKHLISESVLYVSLEPCAHHGKTPPCADLIIKNKIPRVLIGCRDPFEKVNGKGIERLREAGVEAELVNSELKLACQELNKRFFTFHQKQRPYIILKWAQTADGFIAGGEMQQRLMISNKYSNRLVHKWRSEESAVLVGTNTALYDDPELTNRLWSGPSPVRLVLDMNLRLPSTLKLFQPGPSTIIFNLTRHTIKEDMSKRDLETSPQVYYCKLAGKNIPKEISAALFSLGLTSVLIEGGAGLLNSFIDEKLWDETRIITSTQNKIVEGLKAPGLNHAKILREFSIVDDHHQFYGISL